MNRTRVTGRARAAALRGEEATARELVAELVQSLAALEVPNVRTDGFVDAAEVMAMLGDRDAAIEYGREALRLAEAKGNIARAAQVRALIDREEAAIAASAVPAAQ